MKEFLTNNWQAVIGIIGGAIVYIKKRPLAEWALKKQKAESNITTIDALERAVKMYANMLDDLEVRHQAALKKRDEEIAELHLEVEALTNKLNKHIKDEKGSS